MEDTKENVNNTPKKESINDVKSANKPLNNNVNSRIKLLQQRLLEKGVALEDREGQREDREKELKELEGFRLVKYDKGSVSVCNPVTENENVVTTALLNLESSDFPPLPSNDSLSADDNDDEEAYSTADRRIPLAEVTPMPIHSELTGRTTLQKDSCTDDCVMSSEWRDETPSQSPPVVNDTSDTLLETSRASIHALDTTMESLKSLSLIKDYCESVINIHTDAITSEPTSPSKLNMSRREVTLNHSGMCGNNKNLDFLSSTRNIAEDFGEEPDPHSKMDVSTLSRKSPVKKPSGSDEPYPRIPVRSEPFDKHTHGRFQNQSVGQKFFNDALKSPFRESAKPPTLTPFSSKNVTTPTANKKRSSASILNSSFLESDNNSVGTASSVSPAPTVCIENLKEYHVKRRSSSVSKVVRKRLSSRDTVNYSIGFNQGLSYYDHPDEVSSHLSFTNVNSDCSLHKTDVCKIMMDKYYSAARIQQNIMNQAESALNAIRSKSNNSKDADRLFSAMDAESLFLLSTYRRNLFIHKARNLKQGKVPCKCDPKASSGFATASVTLTDITVKVSQRFTNILKSTLPEIFYYFIAIVTFGESDVVFCTTPVSIYDTKQHNLLQLPGTFSCPSVRCDDCVNIEVYAKPISNAKSVSKINEFFKMPFRKRSFNNSESPKNRKDGNKEPCAFEFVGSCAIPITEKQCNKLTLYNRNETIPLDSQLSVSLTYKTNNEFHAQGYLNIFKMTGGFPSWCRYWCVLDNTYLKMWDWKDDSPEDYVIAVPLHWDTQTTCKALPQHMCSRSNTFEITLVKDKQAASSTKFIGNLPAPKGNNSYSIWLSADNERECAMWLETLSMHLQRYTHWNNSANLNSSNTKPLRRLV